MNSKLMAGVVIAAIILIGGGFLISKQNSKNAPKQEQADKMAKDKETTVEDEHMDKMSDDKILGIYMRGGKLLTVWPGSDLAMLGKDVTLKTGIKVMVSGVIMKADGSVISLKEGQVLNLDGSVSAASKEMMEMKVMMGEGEGMMPAQGGSASGGKDDKMMDKKDGGAMQKQGYYKDYSLETAAAEQKTGQKVVLFFHAPWCPYCKAADAAFKANADKIPAGVTVLKTDYDSQTELKAKYGVTYQHTFVQIGSDGNAITKWVSGDIELLAKNIK